MGDVGWGGVGWGYRGVLLCVGLEHFQGFTPALDPVFQDRCLLLIYCNPDQDKGLTKD